MAVAGAKRQTVDLLQVGDLREAFLGKCRPSFEGMQHDAFEQISEGKILEFRQGFQHLQEPLLDPDSGLYALDFDHQRFLVDKLLCYQDTLVRNKRHRPLDIRRRRSDWTYGQERGRDGDATQIGTIMQAYR